MPQFTSTDKLVGNNSSNVTQNWTGAELQAFFGASSDTYTFTQPSASSTWNIQHNLNKFPSVTVIDGYNRVFVGDIEYVDSNNITITFSAAVAGKAYLN